MKIVVLSAHPDDAETGAGGLCARAAQTGHEVLIVHAGAEVRGRQHDGVPESEVRTAEAREAAKILGVKVEFLDYYMGEYPATIESTIVLEKRLRESAPDIVLTQWPVDSHPDHQVVGILPLRSYVGRQTFCLGFYEVFTGHQTLAFQPNRYVDISDVVEQKRNAILAHKSQGPATQVETHEKMSAFRGIQIGRAHAEAFHILGGEMAARFDKLFDDARVHRQSGGMDHFAFDQ
jgi:LmbE family N-acetylglucosaminyl deacetylase